MAFGVFIHREDSIYDDEPGFIHRFSRRYLSRAKALEGGWALYYEPVKVRRSRGYYAAVQVLDVVPDLGRPGMYIARLDPTSLTSFSPVPFRDDTGTPFERGLLGKEGIVGGNKQSAIRIISEDDFFRILDRGTAYAYGVLPRVGAALEVEHQGFDEQQTPFVFDQERRRLTTLLSRPFRNSLFRRVVIRAYDERCAVTGIKLINGGGRAEVDAAHIKPVEHNGPDDVRNGIALSGTAHWMFDRGLITFSDDLDIIISRHVNDRDGVESLINKTGKLIGPLEARDRPHPAFLAWHRENCFKA